MIKAIHFKNYKALRDTTLPLGRLTLLIGPNGSGKSTALGAIRLPRLALKDSAFTAGVAAEDAEMKVEVEWAGTFSGMRSHLWRRRNEGQSFEQTDEKGAKLTEPNHKELAGILMAARVYALDAGQVAAPVELVPDAQLTPTGARLAVVLDRLRDGSPERFEALNEELGRWIPEYDRILFDTPSEGHRAIKLRTREGHHKIAAADISQGTLLALAILTLAYLPDPPPILGLEEPGRGIHPRLLRQVKDAMCRLAYPEAFGEQRKPVQVVATTHSPYMLDLFREHPEEIVIANKVEGNVQFERLIDQPNIKEILGDAPLGEVWYTGILGGVPTHK